MQFDITIDRLEHYFAIRNGGVYRVNTCKFSINHKIDGIVCKSNEEIIFDNKWNLQACILGETDTVSGNAFEKETFIRFDKEGICCYCLYEPEIQSYKCKGDNYTAKLWMGSTGIKLYPSGKLKYFQPADDIEIQGVICKPSGSRGGVHLNENGNLKECTSAVDQTINGVFCGKRFNISFDETGKITNSRKDKIFD